MKTEALWEISNKLRSLCLMRLMASHRISLSFAVLSAISPRFQPILGYFIESWHISELFKDAKPVDEEKQACIDDPAMGCSYT